MSLFGQKVSEARCLYSKFVEEGVSDGKRPELVGGGLIRSLGGWASAKALRGTKDRIKGDERILGDGNFVQEVLEIRPRAMILIGWLAKWQPCLA